MSFLEVSGVLTGAVCVWLAARENIWTWPIGITNNILFFVVFWRSKLYADACLQLFYIAISIYGWWRWSHAESGEGKQPVLTTGRSLSLIIAVLTLVSWGVLYLVLHRFTDSNVPVGDSLTTALSLAAQYMAGRKLLENWAVWIVADVIYIGMYVYKHLYLTSVLYAVFILMCAAGYRRWSASMTDTQLDASEPLPTQ